MSESYWQAVIGSGMHVPRDRPLDEITHELVTMLGHPDPRYREDLAYPLLATWIHAGEYDDLLVGLGDGVAAGLRTGLGTVGGDSVLRRSTSALLLGEIVARDNAADLVSRSALLRWADAGGSWFIREDDLRAWVEGRGWANAVANGAELMASIARSRHLGRVELTVVLDVLADRLVAPTRFTLTHGEPDRLAYAVMVVLHRDLVPLAVVEPWLARLGAATLPPRRRGGATGEWPSAVAATTSAFLRALHLQLVLGVRGRSDVAGDDALFARPPRERADLLLTVIDQIRAESPWLFSTATGRRTLPPAL